MALGFDYAEEDLQRCLKGEGAAPTGKPSQMAFIPYSRWFAWHPVTVGGRCIWLRHIHRRWNPNINSQLDQFGYGCCMGDWEYTL